MEQQSQYPASFLISSLLCVDATAGLSFSSFSDILIEKYTTVTVYNTNVSPNFLMWKSSFRRVSGEPPETLCDPQNVNTRKLGEILVFYIAFYKTKYFKACLTGDTVTENY